MRILSWNVNGIRSAYGKGFLDWLGRDSPDILCLQETKASPRQLTPEQRHPSGYRSFWNSAERPGYSGTAVFCREEPISARNGIGITRFDDEGRVITLEYPKFTLVNAYFPHGSRDLSRLDFKMEFCDAFLRYLRGISKSTVICGDINIAHTELDLARPKDNLGNTGFLPRERSWMDVFLQTGYVDTFRQFCREGGYYTYWLAGSREKNVGWRLDYVLVSGDLVSKLKDAFILPEVRGSDHCPVGVSLGL